MSKHRIIQKYSFLDLRVAMHDGEPIGKPKRLAKKTTAANRKAGKAARRSRKVNRGKR